MLDFRVFLNTKHAVFPPNSQVAATVYLHTDKVLKARKIDVRVIGIAKTSWQEYHTTHYDGQSHTDTEYFNAEIYYLNAYVILWKSHEGSNILQPGLYQFPLAFLIPANAPPSMKGDHGYISYRIRINIDIPWAPDEERFCEFSVCPIIDLNCDRRLALPAATGFMDTETNCCSCVSYPLEIKVSIPKTGYIPGEHILVKIRIDNKTSLKIPKFEIAIMENLLFAANSYSRSMNKSSSRIIASKIVIVDSNVDESKIVYLTVPPLMPSYHKCPIIKNDYSLFVKFTTDAVFTSGPEIKIPITIGSIPLREPSAPSTLVLTSLPTTPVETKKSIDALADANKNTAEKNNEEVAVSPKV
uniref:Arrestin C-terminal-like domain-containing protein n=1 Tax=Panagrolaimus sp. ES5 TaxID=591445 RepID=A0AC34FNW1_9BILA